MVKTEMGGRLAIAVVLLGVAEAPAARIGDVGERGELWGQVARFWSFSDPLVVASVVGCLLLGVVCGVLGSFMVVRKMALVGDALSHAVLPGVVAGFLWNVEKDPVAIFVGAVAAGLLGAVVMRLIRETTKLKPDAALAIVLGGFFAIGAVMLGLVQRMPARGKGGLEEYLFGQASAITGTSLGLIAGVTVLSLVLVLLLWRPLVLSSFDDGFARSVGLPVVVLHYVLMMLLAFAVVVALQAVGVVLVSAMLIIPAATAYLLTERFHVMVMLAAGFGALSAVLGAFFSFLGTELPTGPFMVLSAGGLFAGSFLFAPRHGVLLRWLRRRRQTARVGRENTLKAAFHVMERHGDGKRPVALGELAQMRGVTSGAVGAEVRRLAGYGLAQLRGGEVVLTDAGWRRASEIVRNHRLWELYLTNEVAIAADHVHDDAEEIEHILGERTVRELEALLEQTEEDPHGRPIPVPGE
ncbi:MAG: metal ABC transporter permease [Verrucomicrobiales bacterium]|nr:metal ABC transporter permease [Verrucomicrobiales bacterium]